MSVPCLLSYCVCVLRACPCVCVCSDVLFMLCCFVICVLSACCGSVVCHVVYGNHTQGFNRVVVCARVCVCVLFKHTCIRVIMCFVCVLCCLCLLVCVS